jgi:hypothetical protein
MMMMRMMMMIRTKQPANHPQDWRGGVVIIVADSEPSWEVSPE